ncbi:MAG: phytoene desaturase family protein [Planctomycetota bacterium]
MSKTPSVAIVGAGPGGLSAAVLLAASGAKVTIFESQQRLGGRTSRVSLAGASGDTFGFDRGPTFFLMPYVLDEIFAAAGSKTSDHVELKRLDPMYRLLIGRDAQAPMQIDATQDIPEMARRIAQYSPADGAAFQRFIRDNRKKLALSEPILRKAIRSPLDLASPKHLPILPILKPHKTVHDLLGEYFTDEHIKLAVSFQSKYLGMSPFECPSLFTILPFIEYEFGVWHPMGGCHALMHALAEVAEQGGATIELGAAVDRITFTGQRATGVVVNGQEQRFDAVVVNADAPWALTNLIPEGSRTGSASRYRDDKVDAMRYSCSTYMLYLGVDGAVDHLPHHTIYTSGDYKGNLDDIANNGRLSADPSVYICNASRTDPSLAPGGKSSLYVLVPTPNCRAGKTGDKVDWQREAGPLRERTLDQIERVFGIEDIRARILVEEQITPDDWRASNIKFGATFNLAHNLGQMLHLRPQNKLKGFEGVYLVGGGTHPGSGLPTIFLSSQISSRLLCEEFGLSYAGDRVAVRPIEESPQPIGV